MNRKSVFFLIFFKLFYLDYSISQSNDSIWFVAKDFYKNKDYEKCEKFCESLLEFEENSSLRIRLRYLNGLTKRKLNKRDEAVANFNRVLEIKAKSHIDSLHHAKAIINKGNLFWKEGDLQLAISLFIKSLDVLGQPVSDSENAFFLTYYNIASLYIAVGNNDKALQWIEKGLNKSDEDTKPIYFFYFYKDLNVVYYNKGEYEKAINYGNKAYEIALDENFKSLHVYHLLDGLGAAYFDLDNFEMAKSSFRTAIDYYRENVGSDESLIYNAKLMYASSLVNFGDKEYGYRIIEDIQSNINEYINPYYVEARIASFYREAGDLIEAKKHIDNVIRSINRDTISLLDLKAGYYKLSYNIYNELGDDNAFKFLDKGLLLFNKNIIPSEKELVSSTYDTYELLIKRADVKTNMVNVDDMVFKSDLYNALFILFTNMVNDVSSDQNKFREYNRISGLFEDAILMNYKIYSKTNNDKYLFRILSLIEFSRNILSRKNIEELFYFTEGNIPDSLWFLEKNVKLEINILKDSLSSKLKIQSHDNLLKRLKDKRIELYRIERSMGKHFRTESYFDFNKSIYSSLKNNYTYLDYFVGDSMTYCIVLDRTKINFANLGSTDSIYNYIIEMNQSISNSISVFDDKMIDRYFYSANTLYKKLISPLKKYISSKKLVIIPDKTIEVLPFDCLLSDIPNDRFDFGEYDYMIKEFETFYDISISYRKPKELNLNNSLNIIGLAPKYETEKYKLKHAFSEIQDLKENYEVEILNKDASDLKNDFVHGNIKRDIIHIASHSFSSLNSTNESYILLGDNPETTLDYGEIVLSNVNCKLLVLSSCSSATGKLILGEGSSSLQRAFIQSGSQSVISTLWEVNDMKSKSFWPFFYKKLENNFTTSSALHETKLNFIKSNRREFSFPYYWAGYVLMGNNEVFVYQSKNKWWLSLFLLFPIAFFLFRKNKKNLK